MYSRLEDKPALTIRTEPNLRRTIPSKCRLPITHREAARLQTFPDDFIFIGSKVEVARQIGNAVPPRLAAAVARALKVQIDAQSDYRFGEGRLTCGKEAVGSR